MRDHLVRRSLCLLTLFLLVSPLAAQPEGRIEGTIERGDGAGLGGVTVLIRETSDVKVTDNAGRFAFAGLEPGNYTLLYTLGENTAETSVVVEAGETAEVSSTVDWDVSFAEAITVFSASRRAERIVEAPASVSVITAEEIEREAAHGQLPKLLEFTPGAEVTQSGVYDYNFNTRGFNSSLNRRVATLIDGRDVSVPFLGAQEWAAVSFPLDDLASAELVRGPSAALYGANASSGVLNLTTKRPGEYRGGMIRLTGGELSTLNADVRWAGELGNDWFFKLVGGARNHGDFAVSRVGFAEYSVPCTATGQTDCLPQEVVPLDPVDDDEIFFGGLRLDKDFDNGMLLSLEGGQAEVEGPVFQTGIGRVQLVDVERPWARFNLWDDRWNVLAYFTGRDAPRQTALSSGTNLALDTERYHLEAQGNFDFANGNARLVLGGSYQEEDIDSQDPTTGRQTLLFEPVSADHQALFGQLDWAATGKLKVVLAARFDTSTLHEDQVSPKGSLVYSFNPSNTLRLTYNEAFQVPNYSEFFLQANAALPVDLSAFEAFCSPFGVDCGFAPGPTPVLALGNADLEVEEVETIELGYSGILGRKAYLTVDYYMSENQNFITDLLSNVGTSLGRINPNFGPYMPPDALPDAVADALLATIAAATAAEPALALLSNNFNGNPILAAVSYTNFGEVDSEGVEVGLNYYVNDAWNLNFAYSHFDFEIKGEATGLENILIPNSPENKAAFGLGYTADRWDWSVAARWVDDFRWVVGPFQGDVKSYTTVDLGANYWLSDHFKIGLNVANVLDDEHYEAFGGDLLERRALVNLEYTW